MSDGVHVPLAWLPARLVGAFRLARAGSSWLTAVACLAGGVVCGTALTTDLSGPSGLLPVAFAVLAMPLAASVVATVPQRHPCGTTGQRLRAAALAVAIVLATAGVASISGEDRPEWVRLVLAVAATWVTLSLFGAARHRPSRCIAVAESWPRTAELARQLEASGFEVVGVRTLAGSRPLEDELGVLPGTNVAVPRELLGRGIEQVLLRQGGGRLLCVLPWSEEGTVAVAPRTEIACVRLGGPPLPPAHRAAKRAFDVVVATSALIIVTPVIFAAAIAIRLDSPGRWLFSQERVGVRGQRFRVLKLRTMRVDQDDARHQEYMASLISGTAPSMAGVYKLLDDDRCTRVGRVLRRWSLDELPQLWNVIRGDMSLVGPRPCLPSEVALHPEGALARLAVRPGITGPWQVSGRSRLPFDRMVELDVEYCRRRWSLLRDVWILARTPIAAFWRRETA